MKTASPLILTIGILAARAAVAQDTTEVVIVGVTHSAMLAAESQQPASFRAYFERVRPDAICIERAPSEFARGSHYEFTYEIQNIAVPYARENDIPLCPFDWLPAELRRPSLRHNLLWSRAGCFANLSSGGQNLACIGVSARALLRAAHTWIACVVACCAYYRAANISIGAVPERVCGFVWPAS